MIKVVVIEDDASIRARNIELLQNHFAHKLIMAGEADSVRGAVLLIRDVQPDLVLLDIEIKGGSSFDILDQLRPYSFKVIFVTAFDEYAIKAIKFSAVDYIVKPVDEFEFTLAVDEAIQAIENHQDTTMQNEHLIASYKKETQQKKVVLKTSEALHIVNISDILFCKNDNSYTTFFVNSGEQIMVSKGIREYADLLSDYGFFRPHQSYLVNLNHVNKVDKADGGFVVMNNAMEIPVSSRQKKTLLDLLENL
ncbi:MAG: response regulator transcription factor [Bacteroidales bacterium]|nr:response regulator transcription factor [Bacteroidales bacterium]